MLGRRRRGNVIAVFHHEGEAYAVDNRCPPMGFPLDRGGVKDGILTCHWRHARFNLLPRRHLHPLRRRWAQLPSEREGRTCRTALRPQRGEELYQ